MKNNILYFLRAIPGTGKSTFIMENNLEAFTISMDSLREMISGLSLENEGDLHLSQHKNTLVFGIFKNLLTERMKDGGPIILDNFYSNRSSYKSIVELAKKYGYESKLVDFPEITIDEAIRRNNTRVNYKRVAESRVREMYYDFKNAMSEFALLPVLSTGEAVAEIKVKMEDLLIDLNGYEKVHHIGDLQGTFQPIQDYFKEHKFTNKEFYVFLGDYVDRGVENAEAVRFVLSLKDKKNVVFIKGNHEIHLQNYSYNMPIYSREFRENTLPQLEKQQISRKDIKRFVNKLEDFFAYEFKGKKVLCNHAGIGIVPEFPRMVNPMVYIKGQNSYGYDIDSHFEKQAPTDWYQLHGHRNFESETFYNKVSDVHRRSFSMESDVEFGGKLSVMQLSDSGFELVKIDSKLMKLKGNKVIVDNYENTKEDELALIQDMKSHDFVQEKEMPSKPYISSFNFTKEAFFNKEFDDISTKARGLFINNQTNEIVARGYDKFFNVGEQGIPTAQEDTLKDNMKGRVLTYIKENGFLGILGYDSVQDELFFASKSTCDSDFAEYFKDIFENTVSKENRERIRHDFKKNNSCAVFEVNDPINDPHIVQYKKPHIVLLDVFKRELKLDRDSYEKLEKFGERYGLQIKGKGPAFKDVGAFLNFNNIVANEDPLTTKHQFEGYVAEDENANMIKIKLPYYNYWKQMRGIVHRIKKQKGVMEKNNEKVDRNIEKHKADDRIPADRKEHLINKLNEKRMDFKSDFIENTLERAHFIKQDQYPDAREFLEFLFDKDNNELSDDIVSLRNQFQKKIKQKKLKM
jgi:predicted kinase